MLGYTDQHCNEKIYIYIDIHCNEKENISIYICNIIHVMTLEYTICVTQETLVAKKKKKKRNYRAALGNFLQLLQYCLILHYMIVTLLYNTL